VFTQAYAITTCWWQVILLGPTRRFDVIAATMVTTPWGFLL
jgi:hypothetical protein